MSATLNPDLLRIVAAHAGCSPSDLRPWTHPVFDLGIDGLDVNALIEDLEKQFGFTGTDVEWQAVATLEDIDRLVSELRGTVRPEVLADLERQRKSATAGGRIYFAVSTFVLVAWFGLGWSARSSSGTLAGWMLLTLIVPLGGWVYFIARGVRVRRRWRRERFARYGV
jgi:acyl carrier protein